MIHNLEAIRKQAAPLAANLSEASRVLAVLLDKSGPLAQAAYDAQLDPSEANAERFGAELHRLTEAVKALAVAFEAADSAIEEHFGFLEAAVDEYHKPQEEEE